MSSCKYLDVCRIILCLILIWTLIFEGVAGGCPSVCQCKWRDGKETVSCQDANFIDIPKGLDSTTQVLDLRSNRLIILPKGAFIDAGLIDLQKVWLNHCKLRLLERGAFHKLANLVELHLSDNYLNVVPTDALSDIPGLRNLYLARNNLGDLPASVFTSVPSLVRLDISYNNISSINKYAFRSLSRLEVLKLSGNILTTLSVHVLKPLVALHGLHVDNNPWHCDCHLRLLWQWLLQRNVAASIPPNCHSPIRLKSRGWQTLGEDEFVCVPLVTAVAQRVLAAHGDNVSLACRVETDPNAAVTWLVDDRPVINTSAQTDHRYRVLELGAPKSDVRVSNLTIAGAAVQDEGTYRCVAENKAGRVETNLTLQVSHRIKETALIALDRVFVTGALFGSIAFIFIVSVVSCGVLYRKSKRTRLSVKVVSSTNQSSPQLSLRDHSSQQNLRKLNLVDYHVVPTSDNSNKFRTISESRNLLTRNNRNEVSDKVIIENTQTISPSDCHKPLSTSRISNSLGLKGISKTVSYVEMPRTDCGESDPLLKEIYRETSFIRTAGLTSSQTSLIGYGSPFPDLLDLPRSPQQMGSVDRLPFCTMPRRNKNDDPRGIIADNNSVARYSRLQHRRMSQHLYQRSQRFSLLASEELVKLREATIAALGGERLRWSSALSLELSTTTSGGSLGQPPSLPSTPLTSRILDARLQLAQMQREVMADEDVAEEDESTIYDITDSCHGSTRRLLLSERIGGSTSDEAGHHSKALTSTGGIRCLTDEDFTQQQQKTSSQSTVADQRKLIEEIQKLRARKEELAKMRPGERSKIEGRVEGDVTPTTQARRYEYHAKQLDRFLQEYKNLQEQLYKMKESCDNMQKKKSSGACNRFEAELLPGHKSILNTKGDEDHL